MLSARKSRSNHQRCLLTVLLSLLGAIAASASPHVPVLTDPVPALAGGVWSFSDLDGDFRPDQVRYTSNGSDLQGYRYTVEFEMSAGHTSAPIAIHAEDAWGLRIVPRDVDGDHDLDLVVTSGAYQHPVDVWINDGRGGFAPAGVRRFALSIWTPDSSLEVPVSVVPEDAIASADGSSPAVLTRAGAPDPVNIAVRATFRSKAAVVESPFFGCARPRAPPAV